MNQRELAIVRNDTVRVVRHSNKVGSHRNCIRFSSNETDEHILAKVVYCKYLMSLGKQFLTEAIFESGDRADILVLDDQEIVEIVVSEDIRKTKEDKSKKYPFAVQFYTPSEVDKIVSEGK